MTQRTTVLLALVACGPQVEPDTADRDPVVVIEPSAEDPQVVQETSDDEPPPPPTEPIQASESGAPCDSGVALSLQTAIRSREASQVSAGMKPVGRFACVVLAEGATLTEPLTLAPGRCYTILAHAFPHVTEIDIEMAPNGGLPAPFAGMVLAKDSESGPVATIGKGATCFKSPLPIPAPMVLRVTARKGWGAVALQAFSK